MKIHVAVLAGGDSGEYEVSLASADTVMNTLDPNVFQAWLVHLRAGQFQVHTPDGPKPLHPDFFGFVYQQEDVRFAVAYNIVHGTPGENGVLQGWLEMQGVPYTSPGVLASALTMDKHLTKILVQSLGIPVAKGHIFKRLPTTEETNALVQDLALPCFVKPNHGGSSVATYKIKRKEDFAEAIRSALAVDTQVLIEAFLPGKELSIGVLEYEGRLRALPCTEIIPHGEFFDYEAKYQGASDEITPARIPEPVRLRMEEMAKSIYDLLDLRGMVRIDFMYADPELYFMEVNTVPGFSQASLLPQQLRAAGLDTRAVLSALIYEALRPGQGAASAAK